MLAQRLGCRFAPIRKQGKLPGKTLAVSYEKEYGTVRTRPPLLTMFCGVPLQQLMRSNLIVTFGAQDTFELQADAIKDGDRVVIFDDLLATGATLCVCRQAM